MRYLIYTLWNIYWVLSTPLKINSGVLSQHPIFSGVLSSRVLSVYHLSNPTPLWSFWYDLYQWANCSCIVRLRVCQMQPWVIHIHIKFCFHEYLNILFCFWILLWKMQKYPNLNTYQKYWFMNTFMNTYQIFHFLLIFFTLYGQVLDLNMKFCCLSLCA